MKFIETTAQKINKQAHCPQNPQTQQK